MAVGRNVQTTIQTYGKISYFIKSVLENSQTWRNDCLDH